MVFWHHHLEFKQWFPFTFCHTNKLLTKENMTMFMPKTYLLANTKCYAPPPQIPRWNKSFLVSWNTQQKYTNIFTFFYFKCLAVYLFIGTDGGVVDTVLQTTLVLGVVHGSRRQHRKLVLVGGRLVVQAVAPVTAEGVRVIVNGSLKLGTSRCQREVFGIAYSW